MKHIKNFIVAVSSLALLLSIAVACSSEPAFESAYTKITEGTLQAGSAIDLPEGDPLLTVTGQVGATNEGEQILMDLATIESIGLVEYTVEDPFENEQVVYEGVLMRDLLDVWQVDESATTLKFTALNDYQADVPLDMVQDFPVIFALKQNGTYMTPDYRGPAMLVFPNDHYEFDEATRSYWVWQIKSVDIQ